MANKRQGHTSIGSPDCFCKLSALSCQWTCQDCWAVLWCSSCSPEARKKEEFDSCQLSNWAIDTHFHQFQAALAVKMKRKIKAERQFPFGRAGYSYFHFKALPVTTPLWWGGCHPGLWSWWIQSLQSVHITSTSCPKWTSVGTIFAFLLDKNAFCSGFRYIPNVTNALIYLIMTLQTLFLILIAGLFILVQCCPVEFSWWWKCSLSALSSSFCHRLLFSTLYRASITSYNNFSMMGFLWFVFV